VILPQPKIGHFLVSSDNPIKNAFRRVALLAFFNLRAILVDFFFFVAEVLFFVAQALFGPGQSVPLPRLFPMHGEGPLIR
jgi:hypothetical protein